MPNQRRPGWTSRGVALPDELWAALMALVPKQYPSRNAAFVAACREFIDRHKEKP